MKKVHLFILGIIFCSCQSATKTEGPVTEWTERTEDLTTVVAGIPAYNETTVLYQQDGKDKYKVHLGEPSVVGVADKEEEWGFFQFPSITRTTEGTIVAKWNMAKDAMEEYGKEEPPSMMSLDGGKTWQSNPQSWEEAGANEGVLLPNGDQIKIMTPKPIKESELAMPKPLGSFTRRKSVHTFYKHDELPASRQGVFLARRKKGEKTWQEEHAKLDDPQALRYSLRGMVPVVWWGDMKVAADSSVVACIYPGFQQKPDGTVDLKGGVFFYRSTDNGQSWKILSRIPFQPDIKIDTNAVNKFWFTEPAFEILADGTYLCVIRSHDIYTGPMYVSRSTDQGKTWTKPAAFTPNGVLPKLLQLENGVTVVAAGRPGVQVRFSSDGKGNTWTNPFDMMAFDASESLPFNKDDRGKTEPVSCGYTSLLATGPDKFLVIYSDFMYKNEQGQTRKAIKVREVTVSPL